MERRDLLAYTAVVLVGIGVFGWYASNTGFFNDDWTTAATAHGTTFQGHAAHAWEYYSHRPLYVPYIAALAEILGPHPTLYAWWALTLAVGASCVLYLAFREIGAGMPVALAVAVMALVFPFSNGTVLWHAASHMSLALALFLVGLVLARRAFLAEGRRTLVLHAVSLSLYAGSVLLFEICAGLIAGSALIYLYLVGPRRSLRRWVADLAVIGPLLWFVTHGAATAYDVQSGPGIVANIVTYGREASIILVRTLAPVGNDLASLVLVALMAALIVGARFSEDPVATQFLHDRSGGDHAGARLLVLGVMFLVLGYLPFVLGDVNAYAPLHEGGQNRVNAVSRVGYVTVAVGSWSLLARILGRAFTVVARRRGLDLPGGLRRGSVVFALSVAVAFVASTGSTWSDAAGWLRSWETQRNVLSVIDGQLSDERVVSGALVFGHAQNVDFGIPILGGPRDVTGALRLTLGRPELLAYSVFEGTQVRCGIDELVLHGNMLDGERLAYGDTYAVDVHTERSVRLSSRESCLTVTASYTRGPVWENLG